MSLGLVASSLGCKEQVPLLGSHEQMLHQETAHLDGICLHGAASLSMKSGEQASDGRITGCLPQRKDNLEQSSGRMSGTTRWG